MTPLGPMPTADELAEGIARGDRRALARAITHVERDDAKGRDLLAALYPRTGHAQTIGVTGSAGVGKSTLVGRLAAEQRRRERTVGIVAVDPSSPFSHGALLGDRIRMQALTADSGVFLRSMASRGHLGGLAETASGVVDVLDAAGYDVVIVETVGAGQDEVEVASATQSTVLVTNPSAGDEIQSMKAGLMEVAQLLVVNKADLAGADTAVQQLLSLLVLAGARAWEPPVLKVIARSGEGIDELVDRLDEHQRHVRDSEHADGERRALVRSQLLMLATTALSRRALAEARRSGSLDALVEEVAARRRDPRSAADELLDGLASEASSVEGER
jgi:LAO/AO transport system kinase